MITAQAWAGQTGTESGASIDPHLASQLARLSADSVTRVFVHAGSAAQARRSAIRAGLTVTDTFDKVGVAVAAGSEAAILRLAADRNVAYLEADRPIEFFLDTANTASRGKDARAGFTGTDDQVSTGVDGTGVTIAVVDSGIDGTHPMFQVGGRSKVVRNLKIVCRETAPAYSQNLAGQGQFPPSTCPANAAEQAPFWADFTDQGNDTDTLSAGGHGTHVAGIAAGVDVTMADGTKMYGAAPGAKLVGLSIADGISIYSGAAGLNWVLENHADPCGTGPTADCPAIRIVTNSWGLLGGGEYNSQGIVEKIEGALVAEGVTVLFANGNDGGDGSRNISSPYAQHPAPGVIGVANYDDQGTGTRQGVLNSTSSRGDKTRPATWPDVSAPGTDITSACRLTLPICGTGLDTRDPDYNTITGTSMATPLVAGVAAQLLQAGATSPAQVEDAIVSTAHKFSSGSAYVPDPARPGLTTSFEKGHGLVDAKAAIAQIRNIPIEPTPPPPPPPPTCVDPNAPVISDPEADAIGPVSSGTTGGPNEPALDIREGRLSWDSQAQALTFSVKVTDLAASNPGTSPNISYNYTFNYAGGAYEVEAARMSDGATQFMFGEVIDAEATTARRHLRAVAGSFDATQDTISIVVTNADLAALGIKAFALNDQIDALALVSRRAVPTETTTAGGAADDADATCPYTIGLGSVPSPNQGPTPDGSITLSAPKYSWSGTVTQSVVIPFTGTNTDLCDGAKDTATCERRRIQVTVPTDGAQLTVRATTDTPNDFILRVYKPDGSLFGEFSDPLVNNEATVEGLATVSGVYTVVLRAWYAVNAPYQAYALLGAEPAPAPDAALSLGTPTYSWTGTTEYDAVLPFTGTNAGGCDGARDNDACIVKRVALDLAGGADTLSISAIEDDPSSIYTGFYIYLYGPDGALIGETGTDSASYDVSLSGVYTVVLRAFLWDGNDYTGTITLSS